MSLKDIQSEIDEMNKSVSDQPLSGEVDVEDEDENIIKDKDDNEEDIDKDKDLDLEEINTEDEDNSEDDEIDPTEPPSTELPKEDERDIELRELKEELKKLKSDREKDQSTGPPPTNPPITEEDFLKDIDIDELIRDPSALNKLLNKVYKKTKISTEEDIRKGNELIIRSMPEIVKNNINVINKLKKANDTFYNDNKDLVPFKKVVGAVFEEMLAEDPGESYEKILSKVAIEVRSRLDLNKKAVKKDNPPPLERKKKGKRPKPKPDTTLLEDELDAMNKVLGI